MPKIQKSFEIHNTDRRVLLIEKSVESFQRNNELEEDGILGYKTLIKMYKIKLSV